MNPYLIGIAFAVWLLLRMLEWVLRYAYHMSTVQVVMVDPDSGFGAVTRVRPKGNEFYKDKKAYILDQPARYSSGKGPVWIVHKRHGWCYRVPDDASYDAAHPGYRVLMDSNPQAYYLAIKHNDARDTLESNHTGPDWIVQVAPLALLAIVLIVGMLAYVIYVLGKGAQ